MIITIDGPSGSGKSTLSVMLAKHLNFFCLNSGYLYRGMAYVLKTYYGYDEEKFKNPNIAEISSCIESEKFRYAYEQGITRIYFSDNITQFLKDIEIAKLAAVLGQNEEVRKIIKAYKHKLVEGKDAIIEGRVTGSIVFPDADIKLYVVASDNIRAKRLVELQAKRGNNITQEEALKLINTRDQTDMNRNVDPMVMPEGSIELDTSGLTKEQMLDKAVVLVKKAMKK